MDKGQRMELKEKLINLANKLIQTGVLYRIRTSHLKQVLYYTNPNRYYLKPIVPYRIRKIEIYFSPITSDAAIRFILLNKDNQPVSLVYPLILNNDTQEYHLYDDFTLHEDRNAISSYTNNITSLKRVIRHIQKQVMDVMEKSMLLDIMPTFFDTYKKVNNDIKTIITEFDEIKTTINIDKPEIVWIETK